MKKTKKENKVILQKKSRIKSLPSNKQFKLWVDQVLTSKKNHELVIRIVDEKEITQLNKKYRKKNKLTNILAFPFELPAQLSTDLLGDLIICAPTVRKEAKLQHKTFTAHWAHLTIHGVLHLLGYDHKKQKEAKEMAALEVRYLKNLGFADPY